MGPDPDILVTLRDGETFQPTGNFILIEPQTQKGVTEGGIILPDRTQQPTRIGRVVRVGKGNTCPLTGVEVPIDHVVGSLVVIHPMSMIAGAVKEGGRIYWLFRDSEPVGKIVRDPNAPAVNRLSVLDYRTLKAEGKSPAKPFEVFNGDELLFDSASSETAIALAISRYEQSNPPVDLAKA